MTIGDADTCGRAGLCPIISCRSTNWETYCQKSNLAQFLFGETTSTDRVGKNESLRAQRHFHPIIASCRHAQSQLRSRHLQQTTPPEGARNWNLNPRIPRTITTTKQSSCMTVIKLTWAPGLLMIRTFFPLDLFTSTNI